MKCNQHLSRLIATSRRQDQRLESVVSTGWRNISHGNCDDDAPQRIVGGNVISKKSVFPWSSHSSDLSPLDFFLLGYCNDNVYHNNPQNVIWRTSKISRRFHSKYYNGNVVSLTNFKRRVTEYVHSSADEDIILNTACNCMELSENSQILGLFSRLVFI